VAKYQTKAFLGKRPMILPRDAAGMWVPVDVEFPSVAPVANDLIEICELPIGVKCLDWAEVFPDIDSNGAPALAHSLGIENAGGTDLGSEVWATGLTAGQSTALVRNTTSVPAQGDSTVNRKLAMKVTTAAATYAGAGKVGQILLLLAA
jgi:hypothetical protein